MVIKGKTQMWAIFLVICLVITALSGCSSTKNADNNKAEGSPAVKSSDTPKETSAPEVTDNATKEPVTLTWYYPGNVQQMGDLKSVETEMNKIVNKEINATIELKPIDWAGFDQKLNVMSAGGDVFDLVFTSSWSNDYYSNVAKGTLLPLDDLLSKYAPKFRSTVPDSVWNATKIKGEIYGAINYQIVARSYGPSFPKKYADKYGINMDGLNSYKDFEPYFAKWDESYPPYYVEDTFTNAPPLYGFDSVGGDATPGWVKLDDTNLKVVNQYASEEFKGMAETFYQWREKGYLPKDAALITNEMRAARNKAGNFSMGGMSAPLKPGADMEAKSSWKVDFVSHRVTKPLVTTNAVIATMTGISRTSKNPERAMMFLELINNNKELYRLMTRGIEGKHYTKKTDDLIEVISDGGYNPDSDWMFGNQFNGFYTTPEAADGKIWVETEKMNQEADASPLIGFVFDAEQVKSELAQTESVLKEYVLGFLSGTLNPKDKLAEFLTKLNKAGAEKVIAEKQRQIDEWKKTLTN